MKSEGFVSGCCWKTQGHRQLPKWRPTGGLNTARDADLQAEMVLVRMAKEYVAMYREQAAKSIQQLEALKWQAERRNTLLECHLAQSGPSPVPACSHSTEAGRAGSGSGALHSAEAFLVHESLQPYCVPVTWNLYNMRVTFVQVHQ